MGLDFRLFSLGFFLAAPGFAATVNSGVHCGFQLIVPVVPSPASEPKAYSPRTLHFVAEAAAGRMDFVQLAAHLQNEPLLKEDYAELPYAYTLAQKLLYYREHPLAADHLLTIARLADVSDRFVGAAPMPAAQTQGRFRGLTEKERFLAEKYRDVLAADASFARSSDADLDRYAKEFVARSGSIDRYRVFEALLGRLQRN